LIGEADIAAGMRYRSRASLRFPQQGSLHDGMKARSTAVRLCLFAAVAAEFGPCPCQREQRPIFVERKPDHVPFAGAALGSGAYSEKLNAGTKQRLSGISQQRQCDEAVLRPLVTNGPPNFGGIPQRIIISSRSPSALRNTQAMAGGCPRCHG
jgi:hypothetical protein